MKKWLVLFGTGAFLTLSIFVVVQVVLSDDATSQAVKAVRPEQTGQTQHTFKKTIDKTYRGKYLLFLPEHYGRDETKYPLILFLHGSGERGTNLDLVKKHGPPKIAEEQRNFPFIVLSPQCPNGKWWSDADMVETVMAMLDDVCDKYNVDRQKIYLTGLSMGGFGAWDLATQFPDRFAAVVPVCGGGNPYRARDLKNIPIRIYHGKADKNVPIQRSYEMLVVLKNVGADVELRAYPGVGHDCWTVTYKNPELYEWLQKQKLPQK